MHFAEGKDRWMDEACGQSTVLIPMLCLTKVKLQPTVYVCSAMIHVGIQTRSRNSMFGRSPRHAQNLKDLAFILTLHHRAFQYPLPALASDDVLVKAALVEPVSFRASE